MQPPGLLAAPTYGKQLLPVQCITPTKPPRRETSHITQARERRRVSCITSGVGRTSAGFNPALADVDKQCTGRAFAVTLGLDQKAA